MSGKVYKLENERDLQYDDDDIIIVEEKILKRIMLINNFRRGFQRGKK